MTLSIEALRLRLIGQRPSSGMVDGVARSALWHTTTVPLAEEVDIEFVFDAPESVVAHSIEFLGLPLEEALPLALRLTTRAVPPNPQRVPLGNAPDDLWVLTGQAPYVTAHALLVKEILRTKEGATPAAVLVAVPRQTEVFCYPLVMNNLALAQHMADAMARLSVGYFEETQRAVSPHVYWSDGTTLHTLYRAYEERFLPEPLLEHVIRS